MSHVFHIRLCYSSLMSPHTLLKNYVPVDAFVSRVLSKMVGCALQNVIIDVEFQSLLHFIAENTKAKSIYQRREGWTVGERVLEG